MTGAVSFSNDFKVFTKNVFPKAVQNNLASVKGESWQYVPYLLKVAS